MKQTMKIIWMFIFISVFLSACNNEPSPGELVAQGNEAFNQSQYQEAFQSYAEASDLHPDAGEPFYNMGNTLYRQQAYTNTEQLLIQSLARFAGNPGEQPEQEWTQATHYNLGNTYFSREEWAGAVDAYKEALRLTPDDPAAKYNLELALRRLQEEQEEEQQNQEGGDQDQQDQDQEDQDQQDQDQQDQDQQDQDQQDQDQQGQDQEDQPDQQDAPEEQSQNDQPEGGEEPEPEQAQEGEGDEDQESGEEEPESQPEGEQSSEESSEEGNEDSDASQQQAAQEQQPIDGLTIEQARQLVGTVGENAETLQERLQQIYVAPNPPPEKDW